MQKKSPRRKKGCGVPGCNVRAYEGGYCREHYERLCRSREAMEDAAAALAAPQREHIHDDPERLRALERELGKAEHMYEVVIGYEGRVKWRREMEAVRAELRRLGVEIPASEPSSRIAAEGTR